MWGFNSEDVWLGGEILAHHVKALDGRALWDAGTAAIIGSPLVSRGGGS